MTRNHSRRIRPRTDKRRTLERLEPRRVLDGTVVFNEVMYNPAGDDAVGEWVELHNQMSVDIDMTHWKLAGGVEYAFPDGTILESGQYLVIANDPDAVATKHELVGVLGPYRGRLSNAGDNLELRNQNDRLMNSLDFDDRGDWPLTPDGSGASLAKLHPQQASELAQNWTTSEQVDGTPGGRNFRATSGFIPETVLELDSEWRFDESGTDLGTAWREPNFDDGGWQSGQGLFFAESSALPGPKTTPLELGSTTYYFRTTFELTEEIVGGRGRFRHVVDDGAVFYINGQEVDRYRMPEGPIDFQTQARSVSNARREQGAFFDSELLQVGTNTIAVEVHQQRPTSNDVVFGSELILERPIPEDSTAASNLRFNESTAAGADTFWVELQNSGESDVSLDGFSIESSTGNAAALDGMTISAGGYLQLDRARLGFDGVEDEKLFLYSPNRERAIDALLVSNSAQARSSALSGRWQTPAVATPNAPNQFSFHDEIVINEILYHDRPTYETAAEFALESYLPIDSTWRFDQSGQDLGTAWRQPAFDDADWESGTGLFFKETSRLPGPKNTPLETGQATTYYFRTTFEWDADASDGELVMSHVVDDGAVFYLNGVEFSRFEMPDGEIDYLTRADSVRNGQSVGPLPVPSHLLQPGTNHLAVEVHQSNPTSLDVVFGLQLDVRRATNAGSPFLESDREWIELYNRSDRAVDLSGWAFDSGVSFQLPDGVTLAADEYAVVARDAQQFAGEYPNVRLLGEYDGSLSNSGERLRLVDQSGNVADEFHYYDGGYWPSYADGGGTSLELIDADADNRLPSAWASSREQSKADWIHVEYVETIAPIVHDPPINFNEMVIGLLSAGELLLDNVSVVEDPDGAARELIQNGTFQSDTVGEPADKWRAVGTHRDSRVAVDPDDILNQVLHVFAEGRSSYLSNHLETTLVDNTEVDNGQTYKISYDAKWVGGSPQFRTELYYKDAARTTILPQDPQIGTPGAVNSVAAELGPTMSELSHFPITPSANDSVTVRVKATDPDGVNQATLLYRNDDLGEAFRGVDMTLGVDGYYTAEIPAQPNRDLVQFYVSATDSLGVESVYPPAGPESRALYAVDNSASVDELRHDFRILMTDFDVDELHRDVRMMDNNRRGSTVIYDGTEVFYDIGTRLRGSMFTRQTRDRTGYNLEFPPHQPFRGVHESVALDQNGKDEIFVKFVALQSGNLGGTYDDVLSVTTPSGSGGGAMLAYLSRHTEMFQREQFENGADGTLFKFEGIRVLTSTKDRNDPESLKLYQPIGWVGNFDIQDLGDSKELYRWPFLINRNRAKDDYQPIIDMAKAFSLTGSQLQDRVDELMDMDVWTHTFALMSLLGIGDAYSQGNPHNLNLYVRPSDNKILAFPWDWDFVYSQAPTAPLHGIKNIGKILDLPPYERMLLGHMHDIMQTTLNRDYMTRWADHYGGLIESNLATRLNNMDARNNSVISRLPAEVPFQTELTAPIVTETEMVIPTSDAKVFIPTDENGGDALGQDWIQPDFIPSDDWRDGKAAMGFGSSSSFQELIEFPIPEMEDVSTSVYSRILFDVAEGQQSFDRLILNMRYDDGFVVYLNGQRIAAANAPDTLDWSSRATSSNPNSRAVEPVRFDVTQFADLLREGTNVLAIHGLNRSAGSSDALFVPELAGQEVEILPPPEVQAEGTTLQIAGKAWIDIKTIRLRDAVEPLKMEWTSSTDWTTTLPLQPGRHEMFLDAYDFDGDLVASQQLNVTTDAPQPVVDHLRITELMYHPFDATAQEIAAGFEGDDFEFVEVQNTSSGPNAVSIDVGGVQLTDGIEFTFSAQQLAPGERLVVAKDPAAFAARYGDGISVVGPFDRRLSDQGEQVRLISETGLEIVSISYADGGLWPEFADGQGSSLELIDTSIAVEGTSKFYNWAASDRFLGTPGEGRVEAPDVRINEVLSRTDLPAIALDAIELVNAGDEAVDLSGWYLSDELDQPLKFAIPAGTTLQPGEYVVYDESDFNPTPLNPLPNHFGLSGTRGDDVSLVATDAGAITWLVDEAHFGSSANAVSFGRFAGRMVPLADVSLGAVNGAAAKGALMLSEVNYHPSDAVGNDITDDDLEFIEVTNRSSQPVALDGWRLRGESDFDFPAGLTLQSGESIAVIAFDVEQPANADRLDAFRQHYGLSAETVLLGGLQGRLNNSAGVIRLERPDEVPGGGTVDVLVDELVYDDVAPWPLSDGTGKTLNRQSDDYASDAANWTASDPSIGTHATVDADFNNDGTVDVRDVDILSTAIRLQDRPIDLNGDGATTTDDLRFMINRVLGTSLGDANLDGRFNSADFVAVLVVNEYDDGIPLNSTWAEGDWNADGEFDSRDLVAAFVDGGYTAAARIGNNLALQAAAADDVWGEPVGVDDNDEKLRSLDHDAVLEDAIKPNDAERFFRLS